MTSSQRLGIAVLCGACCLVAPLGSTAAPATSNTIAASEFLYYPPVPSTTERNAGFFDQNDFEFIELLNISPETVLLDGAGFSKGINLALFGSLAPGEYVVAVRDTNALQLRYGPGIRIIGEYTGKLANEGEDVALTNAMGDVIIEFEYDIGSGWPDIVPGNPGGFSAELIAPETAPDHDHGPNWRKSYTPEGTPGRNPDSNTNGIPDLWEVEHFGSAGINPAADPDMDNSDNLDEFNRRTNPNLADTDNDGIIDGYETDTGLFLTPTNTGTDPNLPDTDNDGLLDGVETDTSIYASPANTGTDPTIRDSDSDGFIDGLEVNVGSNPVDPLSFPVPPQITSYTASTNQIVIGDEVTLFWTVTNADQIVINPGFGAVANPAGSITFTPTQTGTLNYNLIASNPYRTVSQQVTLQVFPDAPPTINSFEALTPAIGRGGRTLLRWATDGIVDRLHIGPSVGNVAGTRIVVAPSIAETVIPPSSAWTYLDTGSDQGLAWTTADFDDSVWPVGPGPLGYGEEGLQTHIFFGDQNAKYITYYFRHLFVLTNVHQLNTATLGLMRDDGAQLFLNGTELLRDNLPPGPIDHTTLATQHAEDDGRDYNPHGFDPGLLREGTNLLAVALHQASVLSADVKFDLSLAITRRGIHEVTYTLRAFNDAGTTTNHITIVVDSDVEELVSYHSEWSYHDTAAAVDPGWFLASYNDNGWPIGEGVLGKEDFGGPAVSLIQTPLQLPTESYSTVVYLRTRFNFLAPDPAPDSALLELTHLVDDGAVVYLNGQEVHRIGADPGIDLASRTIGNAVFEGPFTLPLSALVPGENLVAVELRQPYFSTTDVVWGGRLTLRPIPQPALHIANADGTIFMQWDLTAAVLQTAPSPTGPWTNIITTTNFFSTPADQPAAFFRLE